MFQNVPFAFGFNIQTCKVVKTEVACWVTEKPKKSAIHF